MEPLKLVAVSAGLSKPSSTRLLADRLTEATARELTAGERPVEIRVVELRDLAVDIANNLVAGFPSPALRETREAVTGADGLIVVTPVFAASYSGLFKSFFDLIEPDELSGMPVLLGATGGTSRHSLVLEHALRPLFSYLHTLILPTAVFAATDDWGAGADNYAGGLAARIDRAGGEFARLLAGRNPMATAKGPNSAEMDEVVPFEQLLGDLA
ncbi:FMN reductase [Streptomyces sp. AK02-01A]|uniref:FMN reductase n=1 Tax=Streptomyces sp. AK02-01A TaxID=3028648 RepID=UPI0029BDF880|nr:FMN reductase [Streptomyces sp. AK02-01A]MDX3850333.1 FMN reductase [Streptomyces sp. AK02-01A]